MTLRLMPACWAMAGAATASAVTHAIEMGNEFGPDHVFMDVDAIRLGVDFVEVINEEVAKCDVLLALVGRTWLDAQNEAGQRVLDNPDDFVRLEIAAALKRQIPVIPILVDGAKIPPANRLPEELQGLARRNALDLRNASFRADMDKLVRELKTSKRS
jgi:TIR domain